MAAIVAIGLLIYGAVCIWRPDLLWRYHEIQTRVQGLKTERTDEWDQSTLIWGAVAILIAVIILVVAYIAPALIAS